MGKRYCSILYWIYNRKTQTNRTYLSQKSVEGFIAGILFTLLASIIYARVYTEFSTFFWMGFAFVVSLSGTLGDLFESLIKRTCAVKDAGQLIPGHGGILDRIDSLIVAVPAVYLYLIIFLSF